MYFLRGPGHGKALRAVHDSADDGGRGRRSDHFRLVHLDGEAIGTISIIVG
jgi:hypothetical protein